MTASPRDDRKHDEARVGAFINWARAEGAEKLLGMSPTAADVLVVVSRDKFTSDEPILAACDRAGRTADVIYVAVNWKRDKCSDYRYVVVADDLPMPASTGVSPTRFLRANELDQALASSAADAGK